MRKVLAVTALVLAIGVSTLPEIVTAPPAQAWVPGFPGVEIPDLASIGVTPTGVAKFLGMQIAGPLGGFIINKIGLGALLHQSSPDAVALEEIQKQLKEVSRQLTVANQKLSGLQTAFDEFGFRTEYKTFKAYDASVRDVYLYHFLPMVDDTANVINAEKAYKDDPSQTNKESLDNAKASLVSFRNSFYFQFDTQGINKLPGLIHEQLVPQTLQGNYSLLSLYGKVLMGQRRYLTTADSAKLRQLYNDAETTEALASMMKIERWLPSDPPPQNPTLKGNKTNFDLATNEFIDDAVTEAINLPPLIPADVVIDLGSTGATTTNNATMWLPPTPKAVAFPPGSASTPAVDAAIGAVNGRYAAGFDNWQIASRASLTTLLSGFTAWKNYVTSTTTTTLPASDLTPAAFLSSLNGGSGAWKVIKTEPWPYVWSSDVVDTRYCAAGIYWQSTGFHMGVSTSTATPAWAARPQVASYLPRYNRYELCDGELARLTAAPDREGRLLAARSTGMMPIDYMAQGYGPTLAAGAIVRRTDLSGLNLTRADLSNTDLRGSNLSGVTLTGTKLAGATLAEAFTGKIRGAPASLPTGWTLVSKPDPKDPDNPNPPGALVGPGAALAGADLSGTDLTGAQMTGVSSGKTDCTGCALPSGWKWTGSFSGYLVGAGADLTGANLAGANLQSMNLSNVNFTNANLSGANFFGATLTGANFSGANLANANLGLVTLNGANVTEASLTGTNIRNLRSGGVVGSPAGPASVRVGNGYLVGPGVDLNGADLTGADLTGVDLAGARLVSANLTNVNLTNAVMIGSDLRAANVAGAIFATDKDSDLAGISSGQLVGTPKTLPKSARFRVVAGYFVGPDANLATARFPAGSQLGISLSGTNLDSAELAGLNLSGAFLNNAILTSADLSRTNLTGANLSNAQLSGVGSGGVVGNPLLPPGWKLINGYLVGPGAWLQAANLTGANFTGMDLSGADLGAANLANAVWSNTTCPNGTVQSTPCPIGFGANGPTRIDAVADPSGSSVHVTVTPALATGTWKFRIEQLAVNGGWVSYGPTQETAAGSDKVTIELPEGTYRAVLPPQRDYSGFTSAFVVLKK